MSQNLLIVESPSKAKTLKKYLGRGFEIVASYGHVRDLEAKEGAVDPADNFHMKYVLVEKNKKHVDAIAKAVGKADRIYLATDPDREGEAIAWHLGEILKGKKLLKNKKLHRVVFYEITESAVTDAVAKPRQISMPLVSAQQARRALDHLVGFKLSPLLWKKIGSGLSAGRVQSPALRLIVEREQEIENFISREYWSVHLDSHKGKQKFGARLIQYRGDKIEQFTVATENQQNDIVADIEKSAKGTARVIRVERKPKSRQPAPPFTTSTLQQEAVRKLGMTSRSTMSTAQQLYEGVDIGGVTVGLITYMRTDSFSLANEALREIRDYIQKKFDSDYLPHAPIQYRSKSKNAQEAHEAIRPTSVVRTPDSVRKFLTADQAVTLRDDLEAHARLPDDASQVRHDQRRHIGRACRHIVPRHRPDAGFPRFHGGVSGRCRRRRTGRGSQSCRCLRKRKRFRSTAFSANSISPSHRRRYTEASLVKTLEEYGIGRPSTYASIVSTLQERGYALLEKKRFTPTDIGRLVNGFLTTHFGHYVDYQFTANLEEELDEISNGDLDWIAVMREFWSGFSDNLEKKKGIERGIPAPQAEPRVINWSSFSKALLDPQWQKNGRPAEKCPKCKKLVLLQNSSRGLFFGCSGYPKCDYTRPWGGASLGPVILGKDPNTSMEILLLKGPYGHYVQIGQTIKDAKEKPKRAAWSKNVPVPTEASADALALALKLLSLPRQLGAHPETGKPIEASIGRFGPYLKHDGMFKSIPKADNVHDIALARAIQLLAEKKAGGAGGRALGAHPEDGRSVVVHNGRYGPYVKHGKINATIPPSADPAKLTLKDAVELLAAKSAKGSSGKKKLPAKAKGPKRKAA